MNHVSKNITFDSDGVYRWAYELNLYKNPTILFLIWKIFGGILLALWLFMVVLEVIDDNLSLDNLFELTVGLLLFSLGFGLICLLGYLLYALIMGGKYCVLFEMDDKGIHHIQMEAQIKKVEAISILTKLVGAMAGRPGVVGTGMLAGARTSMYTSFLSYFKSLKGKTKYPLYSRYGTHWAESTIPFVSDSILTKIGSLIGQEMPHIVCVDENLTTKCSKQDGEIENLMNLLLPIRKPALPQPIMALSDTTLRKPNILVIADSYFIQLHESCFADAFDRCEYWKYNDEVITKKIEFLGKVKYYPDVYKVIDEVDLVMIINTSVYAYDYMFGFCETAQQAFLERDAESLEKQIHGVIQRITSTPEWFESVKQQAVERGIDLDEMLRLNAIYAIETDKQKQQN